MVLSVTGKIFNLEQRGKWWSFNLNIEGGFVKVIAESEAPLQYKVGDHITAVAKRSRLEKGALKLFSTPGLISLVDNE